MMRDKIGLQDELLTSTGELIIPKEKKPTKIMGEVTIVNGITGKKLFTFNDVIIPGATYAIEKLFNRRSTFGMTTISEDLDINAGTPPSQSNLKDEYIFGFVVGIGGTEVPDVVKAVRFNDKTVETIAPLRVVDIGDDLPILEQSKYAMKKTVGDKYYYYAKKFDTDVTIRHLFTDGTEIPPNIDQTDTSLGMLVYGECVFTISESDLREYFIETYGSIAACRFNSIGLVTGFEDGSDYGGVRVVTKLNIPTLPLSNSESFYKMIYRLYVL